MNDLLQMKEYPNIQTIKDLKDYLHCSLGRNVDFLPCGAIPAGMYALISYLCNFVTQGELTCMIGPYYQNNSVWMLIKRAVDKGYVKKFRLKNHDLGATVSYHLTQDGAEAYLSNLLDDIINWNGVNQDKRTKAMGSEKEGQDGEKKTMPLAPMHDYGLGVSILSLMMLRLPLSVDKEILYVSLDGKSKLRIDAEVRIGNANGTLNKKLYIEQDMGTESAWELLGKLVRYSECELCKDNSCVIISCHSPSGKVKGGGFSFATMKRHYDSFVKGGYKTAYDYYAEQRDKMSLDDVAFMEEMLISVNDGKCDRRNGGLLEKGKETMDGETFASYVKSLEDGNNRYLERKINARLVLRTKETMYAVWKNLKDRIAHDYFIKAFKALVDGWHVYVLPSMLLANSGKLFAGGRKGMEEYVNAVSRYYFDPSKRFEPCEDLESKGIWINYDGWLSTRLTPGNLFSSADGKNILSIEHVGRDVGAFARCLAYSNMDNREKLNLHVIAVFDTVEDFVRFARLVPCIPDKLAEDGTKGFRFSVLFECEMNSDGTSVLFMYEKPFDEDGNFLSARMVNSPDMLKSIKGSIANIRGYQFRNFV